MIKAVGTLGIFGIVLAGVAMGVPFLGEEVRLSPAVRDRVHAIEQSSPTRSDPGSPFDTLVGSLDAGIGVDTPDAFGPILDRIERGRSIEHRAPGHLEPDIDRALVDLDQMCVAMMSTPKPTSNPTVTLGVGLGLLCAAASILRLRFAVLRLERERTELARIAEVSEGDDLGLAIRNLRYAARLEQIRGKAQYERATAQKSIRRLPDTDCASVQNAGIEIPSILLDPPE